MSYKTVLVHADLSPHAPARFRLAAALAQSHGAHLVGAAMTGLSRFVYPDNPSELARTVIAGYADTLYQGASEALARFEAIARASGVASFEPRLVSDDPEGGLVQLSRFCDLLVLSQTDPAHAVAGAVRDLPEYVMLGAVRPVLLAPHARDCAGVDGCAVVAWNGSPEATRAIDHALPLLRCAAQVVVASFDEDGSGRHSAQLPDLLSWLGRHGIEAELHEQKTADGAGSALLSLAQQRRAALIVMGGYGHTRFHELMLGGATRTILTHTTTPVLMSH
ncbi:MAG: universal stress protein [Pseudomonadota bacterium]